MLTFLKNWRARRAFMAAWAVAMADEYKAAMAGKRCMDDMQRRVFRQALLAAHGLTEEAYDAPKASYAEELD